ncbi:MAG: guanosine polyphosphate pyrophosphohydrolase [Acetatifactor sp.]
MITLNDYLYSGHTVLRIIKRYMQDLKASAVENQNEIDLIHCYYLLQIMEILEHNDFLTAQSQKIREFYIYMAQEYSYLSFTFKGRIKSLIRAEAKFNGYIVEYIYDYYFKNGTYPSVPEIKERLNCFRDLIAYRIVISIPRCHLEKKEDREKEEISHLYKIANVLPFFLEERGFTAESAHGVRLSKSDLLDDAVRSYYRDYINCENVSDYRSLHITFFDHSSRCFMEMQLRTKEMDDIAEIGVANHLFYEKKQEESRGRKIQKGECSIFDEAYERCRLLQELELSEVDVNMFAAINNSLMNDGCGLYRGRLILPYEHLSSFQNDIID